MKKFLYFLSLFCLGGWVYQLIELIWRQSTHWSMFIAGGLAVVCIDAACQIMPQNSKLWVKCLAGSAIITTIEFVIGCVVNLQFHMDVWDYSFMPFNIMGQVCLLYSIFWFFLTIPVLYVCKRMKSIRFFRPQSAPHS